MSEAIKKNPYVPPQVFRVELNPEQAILTACSLGTTNVSNGGNHSCRATAKGTREWGIAAHDRPKRPIEGL